MAIAAGGLASSKPKPSEVDMVTNMQRIVIEDASPLALRRLRNQAHDGTDLAKAIDTEFAGRATTIVETEDDDDES